ncbi:hypothetical protein SARC_07470 [Sphaeroforma arctica JP610]|uniref:Guanylate cyclase domain-containing protein n=1 Tax=Sphaeroforma arctica JP610 TaxID=667725 RepID=A0A0L0FTN1_9EUKA|nr:hypothetical protein SARC_07470 [Sphaeroforma arctica JP610]KNC80157.1 hypothetical protein SARC_07470 [Sphaeroforma arctica JP610]|eukprot:XP_014154059.1 hypothetical protein SARC_07470 [Sphaeroforma arctica JP610]
MPHKKRDGVRWLSKKVTSLSLSSGGVSGSNGSASQPEIQVRELLGGYIKLEFGATGHSNQGIKVLEAVLAEVVPQHTYTVDGEQKPSEQETNDTSTRNEGGVDAIRRANSCALYKTPLAKATDKDVSRLSDLHSIKVPSPRSPVEAEESNSKCMLPANTPTDLSETSNWLRRSAVVPDEGCIYTVAGGIAQPLTSGITAPPSAIIAQDVDIPIQQSAVRRNSGGGHRRQTRYGSTTELPSLINIDEGSSKEDLDVLSIGVSAKAGETTTDINHNDAFSEETLAPDELNRARTHSQSSSQSTAQHARQSLPFTRRLSLYNNVDVGADTDSGVTEGSHCTEKCCKGCHSGNCCGSVYGSVCSAHEDTERLRGHAIRQATSADIVYSMDADTNSIHTPSYSQARSDRSDGGRIQQLQKAESTGCILTPVVARGANGLAKHSKADDRHARDTARTLGLQATRIHSHSPAAQARLHRHIGITSGCFPFDIPDNSTPLNKAGISVGKHNFEGEHTRLDSRLLAKRWTSNTKMRRSSSPEAYTQTQTANSGTRLANDAQLPCNSTQNTPIDTEIRGLGRSAFSVYVFLDHSDGSTTAGNANTSTTVVDAQKPLDYLETVGNATPSWGMLPLASPFGSKQTSECSDVIGDYASVAAFVEAIATGEDVGSFKRMMGVKPSNTLKATSSVGSIDGRRPGSSYDHVPPVRRHSTARIPISVASVDDTRGQSEEVVGEGSARVHSQWGIKHALRAKSVDRGARVYNPAWDEQLYVDTHKYTRGSRVRGGLKRVQSKDTSGSDHTNHSHSLSLSQSGERSNSSPLLSGARSGGKAPVPRQIMPTSSTENSVHIVNDLGVVDELDRMLVSTTTLVVVLLQGDSVVGGVSIPLRNITPREMWIELAPVSTVYVEVLERILKSRRLAKTHQLTQMMHINDNTALQQRRKSAEQEGNRSYFHKLMSLRMFLVLLSLCSVLCIVVVTAAVMYNVTMDGLENSYKVVASRIWLRLANDVQGELYLPELLTRTTASTFYNDNIDPQSSADVITYTLRRSWNETRFLNSVHTNNLFVGSIEEYFYATYTQASAVNASVDVLSVAIQNSLISDDTIASGVRNDSLVNPLIRFGPNETCIDLETPQCSVYNTSNIVRVVDGFIVTSRPWFLGAAEKFGTFWSSVYSFTANAALGVTVAIRVPFELDLPVKYVVGADMTLEYLSSKLRSGFLRQNERSNGYAMIISPSNGEMVAVTMEDPETLLFSEVNCSNGLDSTLERYRVVDHDNERISNVGSFLIDLCEEESVCYLTHVDLEPSTQNCPNALPADSDCLDPNTAQLFACQPPIAAFVNATSVPPSNVSNIYVMPNKDILSIGTHSGSDLAVIIAVVIPFEDYGAFYSRVLTITVSLGVIIIIGSLVVSSIVAQIATKPLVECTRNLTNFSHLDFSTPIDSAGINSPLKEIANIYAVMSLMRRSLRSFSKYVPPDVVRLLVKSGLEAKRGGQNRIITSFCTDVVDFTSICEGLSVDQLDILLGDYLMDMSHIVHDCKGVVDKYIGDSIVAIWNAPEIVVDHARLACEAALLCQAKLALLRSKWTVAGLPPFYQRIGIHTGQSVVGNIGSNRRLNYTALGTNVDFASKLEENNKRYGTAILISDVTQNRVKDYFLTRPVDDMVLPGVNPRWCRVYELVAHLEIASAESVVRCESFERAFTTLHDKSDPVLAIRLLNEYREKYLRTNGSAGAGGDGVGQEDLPANQDYVYDKVFDLLYERCMKHKDMRRQRDSLVFTEYSSRRNSVASDGSANCSAVAEGAANDNLLGKSGVHWHQD